MFSKKLGTDAFTNLIAGGTCIDGDVKFTGIIKIQGVVNGDVLCSSAGDNDKTDCIVVDKTGVVSSLKMQANNIVIAGKVTSLEIRAEGTVRILKCAVIKGAVIYYRTLEIEPGALLDDCQMKHLDYCSEGEQT